MMGNDRYAKRKVKQKKEKFLGRNIFMILTVLAFSVSSVSYAASILTLNTNASISAEVSDTSVAIATTDGKYGVEPSWGLAVLSETTALSAGDLYVVNLHSTDGLVTLYLDNPKVLKEDYAYFKMKIAVYKWDSTAGAWTSTSESADILDLNNGYVQFKLSAGAKYSISIDSGDYYTIDTTSPTSPEFSVTVR